MTVKWQEDLFFLINAPAIQQMVKRAQKDVVDGSASARGAKPAGDDGSAQWWMKDILEMGIKDDETSITVKTARGPPPADLPSTGSSSPQPQEQEEAFTAFWEAHPPR